MFRRYPILKGMAAYSVLYPASNITQQLLAASKSGSSDRSLLRQLDWKQVGRYCFYGGLIHSQIVFRWIRYLGKLFPGGTTKDLIKIVAVDIFCFGPVGLSCFYVGLSALEFKSFDEIVAEWKQKVPKSWATAIFYWPIVQAINFKFVRPSNRTVFIGIMAYFWTIALSYWKNQRVSLGPTSDIINYKEDR